LGGNLRGRGLDGDLGGIGGRLLRLVGTMERNLSQQGKAQENREFGFHRVVGGRTAISEPWSKGVNGVRRSILAPAL
jgi:hypothetical protein